MWHVINLLKGLVLISYIMCMKEKRQCVCIHNWPSTVQASKGHKPYSPYTAQGAALETEEAQYRGRWKEENTNHSREFRVMKSETRHK